MEPQIESTISHKERKGRRSRFRHGLLRPHPAACIAHMVACGLALVLATTPSAAQIRPLPLAADSTPSVMSRSRRAMDSGPPPYRADGATPIAPRIRFGPDLMRMQQGPRGFGEKAGIEMIGATAGSIAGLGLGYLISRPDHCSGDDVECILEGLGAMALVNFALAPVSLWEAGRLGRTRPSLLGATIGSAAGVAAGLGVYALIQELDSGEPPPVPTALAYCITHGLVTTIGSRLARAISGSE